MSFSDSIGFREECPHCGQDAHVCKNCEFYDQGSYNDCRETSAEVVREKERANFCDFFQGGSSGGGGATRKEDLLSAAEALFKKK